MTASAGTGRPPEDRWLWMAAAFAVTGASQLVSQLVLGRVLGPADYGQVATLTNLMSFVGVPLVAVQITVTGFVARGSSAGPTLVRAVRWGIAGGAVALVLAPWWSNGLALTSTNACRAAALFVPAAAALAVARGDAVGQSRTKSLAIAMIVGAAVRVVGSAAAAVWFGMTGATAAIVGGEAVIAVVLHLLVGRAGEDRGAIVAGEAAGAAYSQVAMWLIINVDLLWARRLLSPADAGRYLVVGSVAMGLVSFGQAALWHRASASTDAGAGRRIVGRCASVVAVTAVVAVPVAAATLPVLLGSRYRGLTPLLVVGGIWAVLASVVFSSTATQLIAGRRGLRRLVPLAVVAAAGPPVWVAIIGPRPIALSIAGVVNCGLAAAVVAVPQMRPVTGRTTPSAPNRAATREPMVAS